MLFRGKQIDIVRFWSSYVDFPSNEHFNGTFTDLVFCPNPNHLNSRSPAFQINLKRPTCHCFAHCGISGSLEHAVCVIEGIYDKLEVTPADIKNNRKKWEIHEPIEVKRSRQKVRRAYAQARKIIFKHSGAAGAVPVSVAVRKNKARKTVTKAVKVPTNPEAELASYSFLPKEALAYLKNRGITDATLAKWEIGFDEEKERITIPVRDDKGKLLFFIKRGIYKWQRPSYLYPLESPKQRVLFGACALDEAMVSSEGLILVEGSFDTMLMHQWTFRNTSGILGNSLSMFQARLIAKKRPKRVYLFFDGDQGGVQALQSAMWLSQKYPVRVVRYPKKEGGNLDPAKLSRDEVAKQLRKSVPLLRIIQKMREAQKEGFVA